MTYLAYIARTCVARAALLGTGLSVVSALATSPLAAAQSSGPDAERSYTFPIQIDAVQVQVIGGERTDVVARVAGVVGSGCTRLERIQQAREDSTVYLWILGRHSGAEACTMLALLFNEPILVIGDFPAGAYVLEVSGTHPEVHADWQRTLRTDEAVHWREHRHGSQR